MATSPGPPLHRLCRSWSRRGGPGDDLLWRIVAKIQPLPPDAVVEVLSGVPLRVRPADYIDRELYRGRYERAERQVLHQLARPGDTCVDVGANIGAHTLPLASRVGSTGVVIAFEPDPGRAARLRENLHRALLDNVRVEEVAVGATPGRATLHAGPDGNTGAASLHAGRGSGAAATVEVVRVIDRVSPEDLRHAVVKIDVEGHEAEVLRGMELDDTFRGVLLLEVSPEFGPVDYVDDLLERLPRHRAAYLRDSRARPRFDAVRRGAPPLAQRSLLLVPEERAGEVGW